METQRNKEKHLFLSSAAKNKGIPSICAVKQENVLINDVCQLASPTFDSRVKRPLVDSHRDVATPSSKRIKQECDDPSFWANKERRLLSNKSSLQNVVTEVADSFESSTCASFQGFESSNRILPGEDNTMALKRRRRQFESSIQMVPSANEGTAEDENVEAIAPSIDRHEEERLVSPIAENVHPETAKPVRRPLKSLDSGLSEGYAFDHNFFPKLVGVHSALTPTSSIPELESHRGSQQTTYAPLLKKLIQNQETRDRTSSPLQNTEKTMTAASNRNFLGHCKDDKGHAISKNTGQVMSHVTPLLSRTQNATTCNTNLYKRDLLEDSRVRAQNASRAVPANTRGDLPSDFSPERADSHLRLNGNVFNQKEQETRSAQAVASMCKSTDATAVEHAQAQDNKGHDAVDSTSNVSPLHSPVSPTTHDLMYSSKQTSKKSSKRLKSVNKQEMVNIYRMAAGASSPKNQVKSASIHSPPDSASEKPCDLLFSFTKAGGKNDLFLVVNDEVFAVKRLDYKGVSYLIHTDKKGKSSILAKLPEDEKLRLQHDTRSSSGQQFPSNRASGSKQSRRPSCQRLTPQYPIETSLSVTALQTFSEETSRDKAQAMAGQQSILDGISRLTGGQGMQKQTTLADVNKALSQRQAMYGMRTQRDNVRPVSFSRSGTLNPERRQLLKQLLNGIRAGASRQKGKPLDTPCPQSVPASQQQSSSQVSQDRPQGRAIPINAGSNPSGTTHAMWNRCDNQQFNVNPNHVDRNQGNAKRNVYSRKECICTSVQSTCNGNPAVGTCHQPYHIEETIVEENCGNFAKSDGSTNQMSRNRNPERIKLMNYIARRLASKAEQSSSTVNASEYNQPPGAQDGLLQPPSRRSEVERQTSTRTMEDPLSNRATKASTRRHEELPPLQQCQRLMRLLVGSYNVKPDASRNNDGLKSSSRKRTAESSQAANRPAPLTAQGAMDCWINCESELCRKKAATLQAEQRHSLYWLDTTSSDSLTDNESRSGYTYHQCPSENTVTQDDHHVTSSVPEINTSRSSSDYHSGHTSLYGRSYLVCCGQQFRTTKRPPGYEAKVNKCLANNSLNKAVQRSRLTAQRESVPALINDQQRSTNEAPVRGIAEVTESLDDQETDTDDSNDVEVISTPPKRYSTPNTLLHVDDKSAVEQETGKISNGALRAELVAKIQATQQRRAQENVEWKKKYLYRIQTELENKLAMVSGAAHVVVIDDD